MALKQELDRCRSKTQKFLLELCDALESDRFAQVRNRLYKPPTFGDWEPAYCASGLLCLLAEKKHPELRLRCNWRAMVIVPAPVLEVTGVNEFLVDEILRMNDYGASFKEIAEYIRRYIKEGGPRQQR